MSEIEAFCAKDHGETSKFVVKTPFTTNGGQEIFCGDKDKVIARINRLAEAHASVEKNGEIKFSQVFIQPRLVNAFELKVVMFNGKAQYISMRKRPVGSKSFKDVKDDDVMAFAEKAFSSLKASGATITDYLCRADIIQTELRDYYTNPSDRFRINEFENLDADYQPGNSHFDSKAGDVSDSMASYLAKVVKDAYYREI